MLFGFWRPFSKDKMIELLARIKEGRKRRMADEKPFREWKETGERKSGISKRDREP